MLSDLLQCTNEPNVSIPTLANLLIERTLNPNELVQAKAAEEYLSKCGAHQLFNVWLPSSRRR